ncbi:ATP-binding cassette domain-containing protein [Pedobacter sp. MR2016-24]|uniref:ATP-binding cassette domain-containing protein n=1 Tax=Pedobacter sp. MR2016-24 TaxID=2994466 RepID=UPI0022457CA3|nr:ATP-binding cassette domain-containing protein [Pedobacter sp. MR2016-24]MCX2483632.1 ATP-binding cassette domain-containing protein [Pedobacter sp. MR2016-24]
MISIKIDKQIKTYRGKRNLVVEAIIEKGSVTKIYGPSGSGKTTFLKIIAGLIMPDRGLIKVENEVWLDTAGKVNLKPQQRKAGFVFQDYALFPNMTVMEHLLYATSDTVLIDRLLKIGKMETFVQHRPKHLSGGQQQRLAILRALAMRPEVLLMDEAFSALDDELSASLIMDLKLLLKEFNTTTLIVSHHARETAGFAEGSLKIDLD